MPKVATPVEMTDEQFIENLYLNLLERPANSGEVDHWLWVMTSGSARADIVDAFMSSSEYLTLQTQKERFQVSPFSLVTESPQEDKILATFKAHVAAEEEGDEIAGQRSTYKPKQASDVQGGEEAGSISAVAERVREAAAAVGQLNPRNPGLVNYLIQASKRVLRRSLTWYTRPLQEFDSRVTEALQEHGTAIESLQQFASRATRALDEHGSAVELLQQQLNEIPQLQDELLKAQTEQLQQLIGAVEFSSREQLIPFVELFRSASTVVDLGCGRGEFLLLLKQDGIPAYGVDSDQYACEVARAKSLKVVQQDIIEHLQQIPNRSLGGLFCSRVIEFLPRHAQTELLSLASQKLKPGGVIVIETTNPDSRRGHGRISYLDPTHLKAIPAGVLKSSLQSYGFRDVDISIIGSISLGQSFEDSGSRRDEDRRPEVVPDVSTRLSSSPAYVAVGWLR